MKKILLTVMFVCVGVQIIVATVLVLGTTLQPMSQEDQRGVVLLSALFIGVFVYLGIVFWRSERANGE